MRILHLAGRVAACFLTLSNIAFAAENRFFSGIQTFSDLLLPRTTQITAGIGPSYGPDYFGSNDYEVAPELIFNLRFKDYLTFNNDGASINILGDGLFGLSDFEFGPSLRLQGGRGNSANPDIEGLGSIGASPDIGAFAQFRLRNRFVVRARYTHAFINRDNGGRLDVRVSTLLYSGGALSVAADGEIAWITGGRARKFFGVTQEQSENSGLRQFDASGSFQDISAGVATRWQFKKKWALNSYARIGRIIGDVANSPLVDDVGSATQAIVGIHLTHTFEWVRKSEDD